MASAPSFPGVRSLASFFGGIALTVLFRALTYPLRRRRAPSYGKDVFYAAIRAGLDRLTIAQSRYLTRSTTDLYNSFCKTKGEEANTSQLHGQDGTKLAHWIGRPDASVVMLYLHGGGYTQPCSLGHFEYARRLVKDLNSGEASASFAVVFLAYTLAPEATHPTALREAAHLLSHLINEAGRSPSSILVGGDSAGGGLACSLLSHLLHPHPGVPEVKLSTPLLGVFLMSPWVSFATNQDSYRRNAQADTLPVRALHCWSAMYTDQVRGDPEKDSGSVSGDSYTEPARNPSTWWHGLHRVVSTVFVWVGGDEVFVDDVGDFTATLLEGWNDGGGNSDRVLHLETPREAHIQPIMDCMGNDSVKGDAQIAIEAWIKSRIES
ncbi:alpha/beta-hydrolase [Polyplosphaeria fusca]|uniref:Alpha/beta-hydrolase n=1 Tax=Polyplosphaeria fusca TaxID=682080 RepID=A0A9P4QW05_9PLEO|nr:alpha/beta-hydrolase [Polyplosphaeria fusca]